MICVFMSYIVVIHTIIIVYYRDQSDNEDFENMNWLLHQLHK